MNSNGETVIGIDIGYSTTRVAALDGMGRPKLLTNKERQDFTPSCIFLSPTGGQVVVGEHAHAERALHPGCVIAGFKPFMGDDRVIAKWQGQDLKPEHFYAFIIRKALDDSEAILGRRPTAVVVTKPAQWGLKETAAIEEAGRLAGVPVLAAPSEPVSAAVGFGNCQPGDVVLVSDEGCMTLDVSVVEVSGQNGRPSFVVKATAGDLLGGRDFDKLLQDRILDEFKARNGITPDTSDLFFKAALEDAAIVLKHGLSELDAKTVMVECQGKRLVFTMTRAEFETLCKPLLDRAEQLTRQVLADAKLDWPAVSKVLPVGGGSKMPAMRNMLVRLAGADKVRSDVDPDRATAFGAALIGASGRQVVSTDGKLLPATSLFVSDVVSKEIGVLAVDGATGASKVFALVPANSPIPFSRTERFGLCQPGQNSVVVAVVEGKAGAPAAEAVSLGNFCFDNIPAGGDVRERIGLEAKVDAKGVLNLTIVDLSNGRNITGTLRYE